MRYSATPRPRGAWRPAPGERRNHVPTDEPPPLRANQQVAALALRPARRWTPPSTEVDAHHALMQRREASTRAPRRSHRAPAGPGVSSSKRARDSVLQAWLLPRERGTTACWIWRSLLERCCRGFDSRCLHIFSTSLRMVSGFLHPCCTYVACGRKRQGPVENTDRLSPRVGAQVGIALGHLDGDVSHQLLDDVEGGALARRGSPVGPVEPPCVGQVEPVPWSPAASKRACWARGALARRTVAGGPVSSSTL